LAEKADPHPVYISQVERGEKAVSVDARLNGPGGVAADSAGNVYVADSSNHAVRRIAVSASAHH
jgi:DNA-binding beta-propeller fold protein YncE